MRQLFFKYLPRFVVSNNAHQDGFSAKFVNLIGNICCSTKLNGIFLSFQDRTTRFWGHSIDCPKNVFIKHNITDDYDTFLAILFYHI